MEVGLPLAEGDLFRPPKMPSAPSLGSKYDAASIALYVLSIIGLVLFIVVMVIYIIHTVQVSKTRDKIKNDIVEQVPTSTMPPIVF